MQHVDLVRRLMDHFTHHRIVFWYDPKQHFSEVLPKLELDGISVLNMRGASLLATKKRIELDQPEQKFLLYFAYERPARELDWLLDIRLYSSEFHADHAAMILSDLKITQSGLREYIQRRQDFFSVNTRTQTLKSWITEDESEDSLDKKMLAVVVGAKSFETKEILFSLLQQYARQHKDAEDSALENTLAVMGHLKLAPVLWWLLEQEMSYQSEKPLLDDFILKLFCTDLWLQGDKAHRDWLSNKVLPTAAGKASALAFMVGWRADRRFSEDYDFVADQLAGKFELMAHYRHSSPYALQECETFEAIEQCIIKALVTQLLEENTTLDRVMFKNLLSQRLAAHWCQTRPEYHAIYQALRHAERLLNLRNLHIDGFKYPDSSSLWKAYTTEIYRFDQAYRLFNEQAMLVHSKGADILRDLDEHIEALYTNWYLAELSCEWNQLLDSEQRIHSWEFSGILLQRNFYRDVVKRELSTSQVKRVFVIISDALRYEVAQELASLINREKRFSTELRSQTSVLPSYTQLGMAALLPHKALSYLPDNSGVVYADGQSTQGIANRDVILRKVNGMAVSANELFNWNNSEGRDKVRHAEIVYIWHDTIDAIGDKGATEEKTFEACRKAIIELKDLVARIINRLNATRVYITADHGFLFQQQPLSETDKTKLQIKPESTIEAKKRFIIGHQLPDDAFCWHGRLSDTAGSSDDSEFLLPKGIQRFHFTGGARFVHGGTMLQEVCVPILQVKTLQKAQVERRQQRLVGVVAKSQNIKLVSNIDKVSFIQTEPVNEQYRARQLTIYIVDSENHVVSAKETVNFDSDNHGMDQRVRDVTLKLTGKRFDRRHSYTLILEDSETQTPFSRYAVTIDLAIQDDFF
ncbi:BREX-1 system phosphatase PglZ type A [Photorhabdus heterorhabditis]|uniref:BREX-1 system phosphatase PglZ type A n=1 Tax=Photorhabdus heterorhabditis TaxID=880156 RepID=UPI001BD64F45|nr:BREX-1 system phosphatase PglZ type A [Photorhabdus heterorhabditis]MBS9443527.1 BREX-1 system phosphatase PglZ type A [Photorhabdus heterorhabditis]